VKKLFFLAVVLLVSGCKKKSEIQSWPETDAEIISSSNTYLAIEFSTASFTAPAIICDEYQKSVSFARGLERVGTFRHTDAGLVFEGSRKKSLEIVREMIDGAKEPAK
jgi:hypothetical protein